MRGFAPIDKNSTVESQFFFFSSTDGGPEDLGKEEHRFSTVSFPAIDVSTEEAESPYNSRFFGVGQSSARFCAN